MAHCKSQSVALVKCPVCTKTFASWMVNGHIEQCLKKNPTHNASSKCEAFSKANGDAMNSPSHISSRGLANSRKGATIGNEPPSKKAKLDSTSNNKNKFVPLAEKIRPQSLGKYIGQSEVVGEKSALKALLEADEIPSMILWGPPGCGKTTLANIIANTTKLNKAARFVKLSATMSNVSEVKEAVKVAKNEQTMFKRKTILFIDEIHRFNKLQQDTFLPHVENGTITLIGATTENPSFHLNSALLSRCRVIVLKALCSDDIIKILESGVEALGGCVGEVSSESGKICINHDALAMLASLCDGDARSALNGLEIAYHSKQHSTHQDQVINVDDIKATYQRSHIAYDKNGEEHYNIISAFHKSIRGSDDNAALYWLARMIVGGEEPLYIARRLVRIASEDIGLADPLALNQAVSAFQACHFIGKPECDVILAQATVYLARAEKSVEVYKAYNKVVEHIKSYDGPLPSVSLHLRNAPTKLMRSIGYGSGYQYNPDYDFPVNQDYLPKELLEIDFFKS